MSIMVGTGRGAQSGVLVKDARAIEEMNKVDILMDLWLYLFMGIIMLALGFVIVNTMLLAIMERTKEIGMLAAIGMNKQRIFLMSMLESVFMSLTGGIIGIIIGVVIIRYTNHTGINLGSLSEGYEKLGYNPMLYPSLDLVFFINLTIMVIATGILASIYPAKRALKLQPAEAMRID